MPETLPACPECASDLAYEMGALLVCPLCGHEWAAESTDADDAFVITDAHGTVLAEGDTVSITKDLKVKGFGSSIKVGTKVRNIRLVAVEDIVDGHDIDCKVDGFGSMRLKSSVVKKV